MQDGTIPRETPPASPPVRRRLRIWPLVLAGIGLAILLLILFWNWDWFIPLVQTRASAAIGRQVTIRHLHVRLGRQTRVTADDVVVANPAGFPQVAPLAQVGSLTVVADVMQYLQHQAIVLPLIALDRPVLNALALPDKRNNFTLTLPKGGKSQAPPPRIEDLRITGGGGRVVDPALKTDFTLTVSTREPQGSRPGEILVDARGTYAGQPVTGSFRGGGLLTLRGASVAYPIDLRVENGGTKLQLVGTVQNPMNFAGARTQLRLSGASLAALFPLTGIPLPATPPYTISGDVDYAKPKIRFYNFVGRVGSSDLEGEIDEDPGLHGKPDVTMDLRSTRVDLTDLGGLIGTPPGKASTPGQTPAQRAELAQAAHKKTLLPDTPINLPRLKAADLHVKYRAGHIENKFVPFDNIAMAMDVVGGRITIHPLDVGVGRGQIVSNIDLAPDANDTVHAAADIRFRQLDLARIMQATHSFHGQGTIGGEAEIRSTGNSLAAMMGHGNGELKLILLGGGNLSALLVDLSGLEFGNALLSALGVPRQTDIQCFVTDLPLNDGVMSTKVLLLETKEARVVGNGTVNFRDQTLDYSMTTRSHSFSIGSFPGPIDISGPLGSPSIRPGAEIIARAGAAAGLGVLLTPLGALLPTIQFGVGNDNACTRATSEEHEPLRVPHSVRRRVRRG